MNDTHSSRVRDISARTAASGAFVGRYPDNRDVKPTVCTTHV